MPVSCKSNMSNVAECMNSLTMWLAFFLAKTLAFQHAIVNEVFLLVDVVGSAARGVNTPSSTASGAPAARGVKTPSPTASGVPAATLSAAGDGLAQELVTESDGEAQHEGEGDANSPHSSLSHGRVLSTSKFSKFSTFNEFDAHDAK
jgi:hypothetical protein